MRAGILDALYSIERCGRISPLRIPTLFLRKESILASGHSR